MFIAKRHLLRHDELHPLAVLHDRIGERVQAIDERGRHFGLGDQRTKWRVKTKWRITGTGRDHVRFGLVPSEKAGLERFCHESGNLTRPRSRSLADYNACMRSAFLCCLTCCLIILIGASMVTTAQPAGVRLAL